MLAGRPHQAVGNGSRRWMAVGPLTRVHRTRPTGRLARRHRCNVQRCTHRSLARTLALAAALVAPGGGAPARRWARRAAPALLLGPPLTAWSARRNSLDPVRYMLGHLADDVAYGTGVWAGALRARSTARSARSARSSPGTPSALAGQLLRNRLPDETTAIRLVHRCRTKEPQPTE
jgi:hypothetical protein